MKAPGWCGGTYDGYSPNSAPSRTINLFPETLKLEGNASQKRLINVPGKRLYATLPDGPGRAVMAQDGHCYAVGGGSFCEILADGSVTTLGTVAEDDQPATLTGSGSRGHQILITSGGVGYIWHTITHVLVQITDPQFPPNVITGGYLDGYFIVVTADRFQISALLDGLTWGTDVGQRVGAPENIIGAIIDHEVLWLAGATQTEVWYDAGSAAFPIAPVPGVFLEYGLEAAFAITKLGDSICWLGTSDRGGRAVFRNQGYNAVPMSTPGISARLTACRTVADARMWSYEIHGHPFAVLSIPSQELSLQYDVREQEWSELATWNTVLGDYECDRSAWHTYSFGTHLVLDRRTASVWELSMDVYRDGDEPRRWMRRGPVIADDHKLLLHHRAELEGSVGVGLTTGQGSSPQVMLRYSEDQGQTWSSERWATVGALGHFSTRPQWHRLGSSRARVYEMAGTDPVRIVIDNLQLDVTAAVR